MWQWPLVSRGRFEDARTLIAQLEQKIARLEAQRESLVDKIFERHGVRPVFSDPKPMGLAPLVPQEPADPLARQVNTPADEAMRDGATSARSVVAMTEQILAHRHRVAMGTERERPRAIAPKPPTLEEVAAEIEQVLATAVPDGTTLH